MSSEGVGHQVAQGRVGTVWPVGPSGGHGLAGREPGSASCDGPRGKVFGSGVPLSASRLRQGRCCTTRARGAGGHLSRRRSVPTPSEARDDGRADCRTPFLTLGVPVRVTHSHSQQSQESGVLLNVHFTRMLCCI